MTVVFSYVPDYRKPNQQETFTTQYSPNDVTWDFNVNSNVIDTYGGQVIQVLSVNIDNIVIEGQFGAEGARGYTVANGIRSDRPDDTIRSYSGSDGVPGLHAMTEFFRTYFAVQSQGGDPSLPGRYLQIPMSVSYNPGTGWRNWPQIIPYNFPSFSRSLTNFAPIWRVEAHVVEADPHIQRVEMQNSLARLQAAIGYTPHNKFSDPNNNNADKMSIESKIISNFRAMLPKFTQGELENMIWNDISVPYTVDHKKLIDLGKAEYLDGEIDHEVHK